MRIIGSVVVFLLTAPRLPADEPVFSGPQPGERLPAFQATLAVGERVGEPFELVSKAGDDAVLIVFVHEMTRPSIGLARLVTNYAARREREGLQIAIIFLSDDVSQMEARIKRARHALPEDVPIGISVDGQEGPGSYGLNRKMTLTILVAKEGRVTENFALVQPSVAADAPRVGRALAKVLGDEKGPTLAEMDAGGRGRTAMAMSDDRFRAVLAPVMNKTASPDDVQAAAGRVERLAKSNAEFRARVGSVARRVIAAGRLPNYGTKSAQEYLQKWAREFNVSTADSAPRRKNQEPSEDPRRNGESP